MLRGTGLKRLYIILTLIVFVFGSSCGGGGVVNLGGSDDSGNNYDGTGGSLEDILANNLPGTNVMDTGASTYEALLQVGAGLAITDSESQSGKYELKSNLVFDQ